MYQQQRKPVHQVVPPVVASQNETQAKEKLAGYVYEYLLHAGASKSAEMFKSEMLPQHNVSQINLGDSPGFLQDWWCVFWDLYSAAPERREKFEPSQEAKAFHEYGFIPTSAYPPGPPMMNGMHGGPPQFGNGAPGGMVMPQGGIPEGMPGYFGQRGAQPGPSVQSNQASPIPGGHRYAHPGNRSGAPTPLTGMPPNFPGGVQPPPHIFTEQMQRMQAAQAAAQQQRLPPGGGRPGGIPSNYAPIRHPIRPYGPGAVPFLDSPSGTPPFQQQQQQNAMMMQNGGGMCSTNPLMSSPGPGPPGSVPQMGGPSNPDGAHDPRFMIQMPGASNFGMGHHEVSVGTPTSNPSSSQGNGLSMQQAPPDNNSSAPGGQLQSLLNGGDGGGMEMKQSPASHPANNGGTPSHNPGSIQAGGGPSSVAGHGPGSVHSQSGGGGAPNSVSMAAPNSHQTPTSEPTNMDFQGINPSGDDSASEISKIKASLINDFDQRPY